MSRKKAHYEDILEQGKDLIAFYNQNPCIAAYDLLGVDLAPIQRLVFQDMWFKDYVIVVASRGFGKTYMLGLLTALSCMLKPGYRVGLIAPAFRQCFPLISDSYDTFWTSEGLKTTAQEFYDSIISNVTYTQSLSSHNKILNKWKNEERDCIKVECTKGYDIPGTVDHRVAALLDDLSIEYKKLSDVTVEDNLVLKKGFNYFGGDNNIDLTWINDLDLNNSVYNINMPRILDEDISYMLGLICGDGYIENEQSKNRNWLVGYCSEDVELIERYKSILIKKFGFDSLKIREKVSGNTIIIEVSSILLWNYIKNLGMSSKTASDKVIPSYIKKASKSNVVSFLSGLFDTDGGCDVTHNYKYKSCTVHLVSTSKQLCKEVQAVLLNIGIISSFKIRDKAKKTFFKSTGKFHNCKECYRLRISSIENLELFNEVIGFGLGRKSILLNDYITNIVKHNINFCNVLPNSFKYVWDLAELCKNNGADSLIINRYINRYKKYRKTDYDYKSIELLLSIAKDLNLTDNIMYERLSYIIKENLYVVKPTKFSYFKAPSIDIEVENEHCYWSNGFISHNSKMIFSEVEKLYMQSSILREACEKRPIKSTDACYLRFKSVSGMTPSYIEALPLGTDGGKIRGSRFYLIVADELAQIPDTILDMVVRPMAATSLAPMERVRRLERQRLLIESGLATEDDFEVETVNKMVMTSSGYYKFNHMWRRMKDHWVQMEKDLAAGKESAYSVWQIPHWDLPEGFLDKNNIGEARRVMSNAEFRMEYEAAMISDSEGFFKASLLDACTLGSGHTIEFKGEKGSQYILGVDPNQGGKASTGIVIIKIGNINRIVSVLELKRKNTPELVTIIQDLCKDFNVIRIFMDKGGGGKAISDLLEEGYGGVEPIIDRTNEEHVHLQGRHILELVNFNPSWISDANFTTKSMLEDKKLLFPEAPISTLDDFVAKSYETVVTLKSQMLNIIVTQTASGALHFDTPSKGQNKDLYSAIILGAHGARILEKELEEPSAPILYNAGGLIRPRDISTSDFNTIQRVTQESNRITPISAAILKKRIK